MATLDEIILGTTPQQVYDKLSTISEDYPVIPEDGSLCPLHEYFLETHMADVVIYAINNGDEAEGEIDCGVSLEDVRIGGEYYEIPQWMTDFQNRMIGDSVHTMGEAVALLETMYPEVTQ